MERDLSLDGESLEALMSAASERLVRGAVGSSAEPDLIVHVEQVSKADAVDVRVRHKRAAELRLTPDGRRHLGPIRTLGARQDL
jgi:hypothetical protein